MLVLDEEDEEEVLDEVSESTVLPMEGDEHPPATSLFIWHARKNCQ